jgi:hypothetical protein
MVAQPSSGFRAVSRLHFMMGHDMTDADREELDELVYEIGGYMRSSTRRGPTT